jgi:hypothetical protein
MKMGGKDFWFIGFFRFAYWIVGKNTLNVVDLSNFEFVVKELKLTQNGDGKLRFSNWFRVFEMLESFS